MPGFESAIFNLSPGWLPPSCTMLTSNEDLLKSWLAAILIFLPIKPCSCSVLLRTVGKTFFQIEAFTNEILGTIQIRMKDSARHWQWRPYNFILMLSLLFKQFLFDGVNPKLFIMIFRCSHFPHLCYQRTHF